MAEFFLKCTLYVPCCLSIRPNCYGNWLLNQLVANFCSAERVVMTGM